MICIFLNRINDMSKLYIGYDLELLLPAFENRTAPLAKDIVRIVDLVEYLRHHSPLDPSPSRIGRLLVRAPFNGIPKRVRLGTTVQTVVVLRNHRFWLGASSSMVVAYLLTDSSLLD